MQSRVDAGEARLRRAGQQGARLGSAGLGHAGTGLADRCVAEQGATGSNGGDYSALPQRLIAQTLGVDFAPPGGLLHGVLKTVGQLPGVRLAMVRGQGLNLKPRVGRYLLLLSIDTVLQLSRREEALQIAAGEAVLLTPERWSVLQVETGGEFYLIAFEAALLRAGMAELDLCGDLDTGAAALGFQGAEVSGSGGAGSEAPGSAQGGVRELSGMTTLLADARRRQQRAGSDASGLILACYDRILLLSVVEAFFTPATELPLASEAMDNAPCLTQVKRYIRAHLTAEPTGELSIEAIAAALSISRRQLYYLFNERLGVTPLEYIRRLKVRAIYRELSSGDRRTSITDIALKYGFSNPGRFSQHYKRYIGELPSQTLKQTLRSQL